MLYILLGTIAFAFLFYFDVFTLRNEARKKYFCGIMGVSLLMYSSIMIAVTSERYLFHIGIRISAAILWAIAAFLLIYSLFLELPFVKTYGEKNHSSVLVETGTYALCRHPGVIWFAFVFFFYYFATGAAMVLFAGFIWTCLDILHVYLQEKLFFPKMFPEYTAYMTKTPMLIPNISSIKKCISTLFIRRNENDQFRRNA